MFDEALVLIPRILAAILVGYLLGSVPFAYLAARLKGQDIFNTGSRRAGTANVFWNMGRRTALLVFAADVVKGAAAVAIASMLGLSGPLVILGGGAAVVGHWKSVFTRFRGGDGMVTLIGVTLMTLEPVLTTVGIVVGLSTVILMRKSPFRSSAGIAACYVLLLIITQYFYHHNQRDLVLGLAVLAVLVMFPNVLIHRRVAAANSPDELSLVLEEEDGLDDDADIGHGARENTPL